MKKGTDTGEQELAKRCAKGERIALKELYIRYAAKLNALCSRYSEGPEEGMDLMHETMLKVFETIGKYSYKGEGSLYAWIRRIAVNLAIDRLRKENKIDIVSLEDVPLDFIAPEPSDLKMIPEPVLRGFISSLPVSKRIIFNMFCIEGLSHKEIAFRLGITEGASTSSLAKAKRSLAKMINDYLEKKQ